MSQFDQIAQALQGFGAGVNGRGPEFMAGLAQQEELRLAKEEERKAKRRGAMIFDNRISLDHLRNGRVQEAIIHMEQRLPLIQKLGGDPKDTVERIQKLRAGDIDWVLNDATLTDREAVLRGEIEPPPWEKQAQQDAIYARDRAAKAEDLKNEYGYKAELERQKQRAINQYKEPAKPTQAEIIQEIRAKKLPPDEERELLLVNGGAALVKDRDAKKLADKEKRDMVARSRAGIAIIDELLNAKPEPGPADYFPPVWAYNKLTGGGRTPLEQTSGIESMFPTIPGSPSSNAKASIERIQGMNFLKVIGEMKGSGTITEIEGDKGQAAMARIQEGQSDESMKQGLRELREVLASGVEGLAVPPNGTTAYNPTTGQKIIVRDGKWVSQ